MKLINILLAVEKYTLLQGNIDQNIGMIRIDSRNVTEDDLFVAIRGVDVDGHKFIRKAIENGASAIVLEDETYIPQDTSITIIIVKNCRRALAYLAAAFYNFPARKLNVIGITGTDGKTTTSTLVHHMLKHAGYKAGLITTINAIIGDQVYETGFHTTTPDALSIQRYLSEMVDAGCDYAVVETSSHGLAQYRVEACEYDSAVLTNITSEHLDYHKTREEYIHAKAHLFELLPTSYKKKNTPKISILNRDDPGFDEFAQFPADIKFSYGLGQTADFQAKNVTSEDGKLSFTLHSPFGQIHIESPLLGDYNVYNILAACAVASSQNIPLTDCTEAIKNMSAVKGRMETVLHDKGNFRVIIDFAHTAHALEQALKTIRSFTPNMVHVVFGSAGLRDKYKRRNMGIAAGRIADKIYITADDPRTESVDDIIDEIAAGCMQLERKEGIDFFKIPDREKAIETAILSARDGDTVIACGKAHESTISYGTKELPWNEYDVVQRALQKRVLKLTEKRAGKKE